MTKPLTVKMPVEISFEAISSLLCSAFEGGSNYWYEIADEIAPKEADLWSDDTFKGDTCSHVQYPLSVGGKIIVRDVLDETCDVKLYTLDLEAIKRGLKAMATKEPHHLADVLRENADSVTGDVFLQCCLFGKAIYG